MDLLKNDERHMGSFFLSSQVQAKSKVSEWFHFWLVFLANSHIMTQL